MRLIFVGKQLNRRHMKNKTYGKLLRFGFRHGKLFGIGIEVPVLEGKL